MPPDGELRAVPRIACRGNAVELRCRLSVAPPGGRRCVRWYADGVPAAPLRTAAPECVCAGSLRAGDCLAAQRWGEAAAAGASGCDCGRVRAGSDLFGMRGFVEGQSDAPLVGPLHALRVPCGCCHSHP
ncbi:hypothetical protein ERJ75_000183200 [Trypanosoma vivax]|nr:hypothetical protein ERJ75_000183200 [Trypanosoma vivax]